MRLSLVPPRSYRPEILDAPGNRYEDLAPALRDIGRVNRWLGGSSAVVRSVCRVAAQLELREFTLLDVGTGGGDVPRAVLTAAARRGIAVRAAGVDLDPHIVRFAAGLRPDATSCRPMPHSPIDGSASSVFPPSMRSEDPELPSGASSVFPRSTRSEDTGFPSVASSVSPHSMRSEDAALRSGISHVSTRAERADDRRPRAPGESVGTQSHPSLPGFSVLRGDGFALPFPDRSLDFVTCSLFLHHFNEREASRLLAEFGRVARRAVVVNDLARHLVPWAAISVLAALFAESPMFRHDAPLSVLRGWTAKELLGVAEGAGLRGEARLSRRAPYRIVLCVERKGVL